ncbi:hypothetical protein [Cohnella luojiensis]|uniref:SWIM-type domain-containing protein n=1 Tax=Cohnella luojiensis TaxID=652876 RepID=A0A4Y8M000_9BACL|nr:hypothetical protein [Cohnella luojiensis]TFE26670.1 hypothetical protein E2980_11175 [Cohnella luojiensis]
MNFDRNKPWTEEVERNLAKQLSGFAVRQIFQEGVQLFQTGYVQDGEWDNGITYSARLPQGTSNYKVSIHFGFLPFSRCSCGIKGSCAHMIAVVCDALFSCDVPVFVFIRKHGLASVEGTPPSTSVQQQLAATIEVSQKIDMPIKPANPTLAEPQAAPVESDLPTTWDGYRKWHRQFEKNMPSYSQPIAQFIKWVDHNLLRTSLNWADEERKLLFSAHVWLYAFKLADRSFNHQRYAFDSIGTNLQTLLQEFNKTLIKLSSLTRDSGRLAQDLEGLCAIVGEYGFDYSRSYVDWMDIYRGLWSRLPAEPHAIIREKARLLEMIDSQVDSIRRVKALLGMTHMIQLEKGPEAATAYVEEYWHSGPSPFYGYLIAYSRSENWRYLSIWLNCLSQLVSKYGHEGDVYDLLSFWEPMAEATLSSDKFIEHLEMFMENLLPAGFQPYADVLLKRGDFKRWVDLHLAYDKLPDESDGYALVERKAPELLLPVYHRYAAEWIETRKRDGYQYAIAHLKRLQKLYGKLKQQESWNAYMNKLLERYSRLKALQEEVRKGHLVPK